MENKKKISNKEKGFVDTILLVWPAAPMFTIAFELTNRAMYPLAEIRDGKLVQVMERLHPGWARLKIRI